MKINKMKIKFLALLIIIPFFDSFSQTDSTFIIPKPKLVFSFDGRFSFVKNDAVNISGLKLGLDFNNKWRVGIGFYGLLKPASYVSNAIVKMGGKDDTVSFHSDTKLWYGALYAEYVLAHKERWEISIPVQFGIGETKIDASPIGNVSANIQSDINQGDLVKTVYLLEPSITGYYKVFNWIGVGTGLGYRQLIGADSRLNSIFNNPIFIIKAKIFLGDVTDILIGRKPAFRYVK